MEDPLARLERARRQFNESGHASAAWDALLDAERDLARSMGEQYAEVLDLGVHWDVGAPEPHVVSNGHRAFVVCYVGDPAPHPGGTTVRVVSPSDQHEDSFAVVDVWGCRSLRMGMPNDEAIRGHPLWGRGLRAYAAHRVADSTWLEEHIEWNSVHPLHSDAEWRRVSHFVLAFHDEMVEVLAKGIEAHAVRGTMGGLLQRCLDTLVHGPHRH
jgi:hypothetical protein